MRSGKLNPKQRIKEEETAYVRLSSPVVLKEHMNEEIVDSIN